MEAPSPRTRADAVLLHRQLTPALALEAFATSEGVEWLRAFPNIVAIAARAYAQLPELLGQHMPSDLIAIQVCAILDGEKMADPNSALDCPFD